MRTMLTIKLAFAFMALSVIVNAEEPSINLLLTKIRAELPKDWTASYDEDHAWLEISSIEAVLSVSALPNGSPDEEAERRPFVFAFRVDEAIDPKAFRLLLAQNEQTQKKLAAIYQELINKRVSHKFDSFLPSTKDEKVAVAQYEALKKSLHELPDFYFGTVSMNWAFNSPDNPTISVIDDRVRDECAKVQDKVVKLLTKYDAAELDGTGQPAIRTEAKSDGNENPNPEAEGRSR